MSNNNYQKFPDNLYGVTQPEKIDLKSFLDYKREIELKIIETENQFKQRRRYFQEMLDDEEASIKLRAILTLTSLEKFKHTLESKNINNKLTDLNR